MKQLFLVLITASVFAACKKDNPPASCETVYVTAYDTDTVYPSSYLMAYPGSVWSYDDGSSATCDAWEQFGIVQASTFNKCQAVKTTYTIVPHTSFGSIHGLNKLDFYGNNNSTIFHPLLATVPGDFYYEVTQIYGEQQYSNKVTDSSSVVEVLDSMEVLGVMYYDVIHVHWYHSLYYDHIYNGPRQSGETYYANHIGPIRIDENNSFFGQASVHKKLVSYTIGPH